MNAVCRNVRRIAGVEDVETNESNIKIIESYLI